MTKTTTTEKSVEKFDSEIYFIEAYERTKETYEKTKERFDNYRKETEETIAKLKTEKEQLKKQLNKKNTKRMKKKKIKTPIIKQVEQEIKKNG